MGSTTGLLAVSEVLCRDAKVADSALELGRRLLVYACRCFDVLLRHELGNSAGHGTDVCPGKRAYASSGLGVSFSTPAS